MRRLNVNKSLSKDTVSKYQNADAQNQEPQYMIFDLYRGTLVPNPNQKGGYYNPMTEEEAREFASNIDVLSLNLRYASSEQEKADAIKKSADFVKSTLGDRKFKGENVDLFLYSEFNHNYELNRFVVLPAAKEGTDQFTLNKYLVNLMAGIPHEVLIEQSGFENIDEILTKFDNNKLTIGPHADFGKIVDNVDEAGNKQYRTSYGNLPFPISGNSTLKQIIASDKAQVPLEDEAKKVFNNIYNLGSTSIYNFDGVKHNLEKALGSDLGAINYIEENRTFNIDDNQNLSSLEDMAGVSLEDVPARGALIIDNESADFFQSYKEYESNLQSAVRSYGASGEGKLKEGDYIDAIGYTPFFLTSQIVDSNGDRFFKHLVVKSIADDGEVTRGLELRTEEGNKLVDLDAPLESDGKFYLTFKGNGNHPHQFKTKDESYFSKELENAINQGILFHEASIHSFGDEVSPNQLTDNILAFLPDEYFKTVKGEVNIDGVRVPKDDVLEKVKEVSDFIIEHSTAFRKPGEYPSYLEELEDVVLKFDENYDIRARSKAQMDMLEGYSLLSPEYQVDLDKILDPSLSGNYLQPTMRRVRDSKTGLITEVPGEDIAIFNPGTQQIDYDKVVAGTYINGKFYAYPDIMQTTLMKGLGLSNTRFPFQLGAFRDEPNFKMFGKGIPFLYNNPKHNPNDTYNVGSYSGVFRNEYPNLAMYSTDAGMLLRAPITYLGKFLTGTNWLLAQAQQDEDKIRRLTENLDTPGFQGNYLKISPSHKAYGTGGEGLPKSIFGTEGKFMGKDLEGNEYWLTYGSGIPASIQGPGISFGYFTDPYTGGDTPTSEIRTQDIYGRGSYIDADRFTPLVQDQGYATNPVPYQGLLSGVLSPAFKENNPNAYGLLNFGAEILFDPLTWFGGGALRRGPSLVADASKFKLTTKPFLGNPGKLSSTPVGTFARKASFGVDRLGVIDTPVGKFVMRREGFGPFGRRNFTYEWADNQGALAQIRAQVPGLSKRILTGQRIFNPIPKIQSFSLADDAFSRLSNRPFVQTPPLTDLDIAKFGNQMRQDFLGFKPNLFGDFGEQQLLFNMFRRGPGGIGRSGGVPPSSNPGFTFDASYLPKGINPLELTNKPTLIPLN